MMTTHTPPHIKKLNALSCDYVASKMSLRQAAEATTERPEDIPERMANAFHEAAHMVAMAHFNIWAEVVYVPTVTLKGKQRGCPVMFRQRNAGLLTDYRSPTPFDEVFLQEDAVCDLVGEVAECINGTIPNATGPVFRKQTPDAIHANDQCLKFQWQLRDALSDPDSLAYCAQWLQANGRPLQGSGAAPTLTDQQMVDQWRPRREREALYIMADDFELIDAVGAVILCHADKTGTLPVNIRHNAWIKHQLGIHPLCRKVLERRCAYEYPDWLEQYRGRSRNWIDFKRMREVIQGMKAARAPLPDDWMDFLD